MAHEGHTGIDEKYVSYLAADMHLSMASLSQGVKHTCSSGTMDQMEFALYWSARHMTLQGS